MIRGLYTAATGMNSMQHQIDVTSNNIANVNTTGFKQDRAEFQDLMYESLSYTAGRTSESTRNPTGLDVGLGVRVSGIQKNFLQGNLKETGNSLDIAIEGSGFFKVILPSGEESFSRNGGFKLDEDGAMVNGSGFKLEPEIIIPDNLTDVSIAQDGIVTALDPQTGNTEELGQITITTFINPAGLKPLGDSLYQETDTSGTGVEGNPGDDALGLIRQGMVESSNVKLVNEMVDLITAQRAYESNSKSLSTADEMLEIVNRLKN